jgi:two-component system chemotaxis sensor kinase CheA
VREDWLPIVSLADVMAAPPAPHGTPPMLVLVQAEGRRVALEVGQLVGQQQVVVKNLESNYQRVPGVSGATIMGDGSVALILDVATLAKGTLDPVAAPSSAAVPAPSSPAESGRQPGLAPSAAPALSASLTA